MGGHSWLEMAPRERQKPFHFLNTSVDKQILNLHELLANDSIIKCLLKWLKWLNGLYKFIDGRGSFSMA